MSKNELQQMLGEHQVAEACGLTVERLRELYKLGLFPSPEFTTRMRRGMRPIWTRAQLQGLVRNG